LHALTSRTTCLTGFATDSTSPAKGQQSIPAFPEKGLTLQGGSDIIAKHETLKNSAEFIALGLP